MDRRCIVESSFVKTAKWMKDTQLWPAWSWSDRSMSDTVPETHAGLAVRRYNALSMHRLISIAAVALSLAVPVWAQHGGGGHGGGGGHAGGFGGGHAGFSGGHAGGFSGHAGVGSRSFGAHAYSGSRAGSRSFARPFTRPSFSTRASRGPFLHDGFRGQHFRGYGYNNCWGYACRGGYAYPWWGYYDPYWYDPYWLYDSDSSYDDSYGQNLAQAAEMNRENLEEQRMLRQEEAQGDQDVYMQPHHNVPNTASGSEKDEKKGTPVLPSTVLVFRDQHKEEIENYAIVGSTLYNFQPQHTEKIALSSLDLEATAKANDDRGMKFNVPQAQ